MVYIFVLASFVPPQSGGMIPFSYKHYHHDITSRYHKIIVVVECYCYLYILWLWGPDHIPPISLDTFVTFLENLTLASTGALPRKLSCQQQQLFPLFIFAECIRQNAIFSQKLHSRLHGSHFFHIFRDLLVWPQCTPCKNCTHSRVLAQFSFTPFLNRVSLSRFSFIFDLQFLFHHDSHLKRVSLPRFSIIFDLHLSLHHNFHLKRASPPHYAAQPRSLL